MSNLIPFNFDDSLVRSTLVDDDEADTHNVSTHEGGHLTGE